jgi:hypothetical protein
MTSRWDELTGEINRTATEGIPAGRLKKLSSQPNRKMQNAQLAALPSRSQVLPQSESIMVAGRHAFIMKPEGSEDDRTQINRPWIFYAPTLSAYPDRHEAAMHQRFLDAGIAIAGIDVGETYGSPLAFPFFEALYAEMKSRGYSDRPVLLGRSRGGLWVSSWAIQNPNRVQAIAGIYPVFDFITYPGIERAAPAYDKSTEELLANQETLNPISKIKILAKRSLPMFIIHGETDTVVPIAPNSATVETVYQQNGSAKHFTMKRISGQGHNFWPGFFNCDELIDFVIDQAKRTATELETQPN